MTTPENRFVKMPLVSTLNGEVIGFEILLREFNGVGLEVFNRNPELYATLCYPILRTIFELDFAGKIRDDSEQLYLNLTADQIMSSGIKKFFLAYQKSGVVIKNVIIELTEQEINYSSPYFKRRLLLLKKAGFQLSIDDFGVKGSNFRRVFELDPYSVKLDKGFVAWCSDDQLHRTMLIELVEMLHKIGKKVVLEGVETEEQFEIAKACSVDLIQGYYLGYPEPI